MRHDLINLLAAGLFAACGSALAASPSSLNAGDAAAQSPSSPYYGADLERGWHYDIAVGAGIEPTYAGSDETGVEPGLLALATYKSRAGHSYSIGLGDLIGRFRLSEHWQLAAALEYEPGRENDEDDALTGLNEVDATVEGQLTLARRQGPWTTYAVLQPDLLGNANKGLVWFLGGAYDRFLSPRTRLGLRLDVSGGNAEYMQTEFGITAAEASRTQYDAYTPGGGLKSTTLGTELEYQFGGGWSLLGGVNLERYFSDAADSPLIRDEGTDLTYEGTVFLRKRF